MPTNVLRRSTPRPAAAIPAGSPGGSASGARIVRIAVGRVIVHVRLLDTPTAERIWQQLPIFSVAETWGECIHFETPVETGRERSARLNATPGDVCYWTEDDRVMIGFGPTPISKPGEIRLMRPCNVFGAALDDVRALAVVTPGEKVAMERA